MRWAVTLVMMPVSTLADPALECVGASSQIEVGACVARMESDVAAAVTAAYGFAAEAAVDLDSVTGRDVARPALDAAQDAWTRYRDAQCEAVGASFGGGSGTGIAISSCRIELGRARAAELLRLAR